jgi:hypothetical protein
MKFPAFCAVASKIFDSASNPLFRSANRFPHLMPHEMQKLFSTPSPALDKMLIKRLPELSVF